MKFDNLKQDKGVAGLTILLSLVTMLFVIGLLVFIYALMGSEMGSTNSVLQSFATTNESIGVPTTTGVTLALGSNSLGVCNSVTMWNGTLGTELLPVNVANYTQTNCVLTNVTGEFTEYASLYVDYAGTYAGASYDVINDTTGAISSVTDWFDIFIVIGAMVVLILLTVIIITAIRSSGMMGGSTNAGNVGSA